MRHASSTFKRAAIGGSLVLLVVLLGVVLLDRADRGGGTADQGVKRKGAPQTIIADVDSRGTVFTRGSMMIGATADGRIRWRLPLGKGYQFADAVCTTACPRAEVGLVRDQSPVPELPDGPRLRFSPPDWRPSEARPRLRLDRPLLPGPVPLRVTMAKPTGGPSLVLADGKSVKLPTTDLFAVLAANRRVGIIVSGGSGRRQRVFVLRRGATGWVLRSAIPVSPPADSACISSDGSRIGLVGGGLPRTVEVGGDRTRVPRTVRGASPVEGDAGACALARETFSTAVLKTDGTGGQQAIPVRIHTRRRVRSISLNGRFGDLFVSDRTDATAVVLEGKVTLIASNGQRSVWTGIDAASAAGAGRLWLMPRTGRTYSRSF